MTYAWIFSIAQCLAGAARWIYDRADELESWAERKYNERRAK